MVIWHLGDHHQGRVGLGGVLVPQGVVSQRDSVDSLPILFFVLRKGVVWYGCLGSPMLVWFEWGKEGGSRLMGLNLVGKWFGPLCDEPDPEGARCFRDVSEGVANAVVRKGPFDSHGAVWNRKYGWEFNKLEHVQGVAVGWKELCELGVVGFCEVWSFRERAAWHVCRDHCEEVSDCGCVDAVELRQGSGIGGRPYNNVLLGCLCL